MPESAKCTNCARDAVRTRQSYRYTESGLSNVFLQGVYVSECRNCGNVDVAIPSVARVHKAIAAALANSPSRLTGPQLRFLRKHLGQTGEQLAAYLHTDKTKISKWESGTHPIGPSTDRLVRLLVAALDKELIADIASVVAHLPSISDEFGDDQELHLDVTTLKPSFLKVHRA